MQPEKIRVSLRLEPDQDTEEFLLRLEEDLGRPPEIAQRLRTVKVLSLWLSAPELDRVRRMPGVLRAAREERRELPPPPIRHVK